MNMAMRHQLWLDIYKIDLFITIIFMVCNVKPSMANYVEPTMTGNSFSDEQTHSKYSLLSSYAQSTMDSYIGAIIESLIFVLSCVAM